MNQFTTIEAPLHVYQENDQNNGNIAGKLLNLSAQFWFSITLAGQWIFLLYVIYFYGGATVTGDFLAWNKVLPHGYVAGDTLGNLILGIHLLFAAVVILGGPLQLAPQVRRYAPGFHRWNGRIYVISSMAAAVGGLFFLWTRGTLGGLTQHIGISLNAVLIIVCAIMAWRYALVRQFILHRIWAIRLFLVVSGVWFFRVLLMLWIMVNKGPAGFNPETFQGPALNFLSFAQYFLPLAIFEVYWRIHAGSNSTAKITMAVGLVLATIMLGAGIVAATLFMWAPRIG